MEHFSDTPNPVIQAGDQLELHPLTVSDAPELFELIDRNRDRLREWVPWLEPTYSLADARDFAAASERQNREAMSMTAALRLSGRLCGVISLHRIDIAHRNSSLGYWLAEEFQGQGIMTRACRALITQAFREYNLHRMEIRCATGNHRSCAIPRRLGFTEEGVLRQAEWLYDHWVDLRVFGMLEQDWPTHEPSVLDGTR